MCILQLQCAGTCLPKQVWLTTTLTHFVVILQLPFLSCWVHSSANHLAAAGMATLRLLRTSLQLAEMSTRRTKMGALLCTMLVSCFRHSGASCLVGSWLQTHVPVLHTNGEVCCQLVKLCLPGSQLCTPCFIWVHLFLCTMSVNMA